MGGSSWKHSRECVKFLLLNGTMCMHVCVFGAILQRRDVCMYACMYVSVVPCFDVIRMYVRMYVCMHGAMVEWHGGAFVDVKVAYEKTWMPHMLLTESSTCQ
jgi:hypothetical protein